MRNLLRSAAHGLLSFLAVLLLATSLVAPNTARADAADVMETICEKASDVCGGGIAFKGVIDKCFKGGLDVDCAIAISNVASGNAIGESQQYVDAIVSCVNAGLPLEGQCATILAQANIPAPEVNQTFEIVKQCMNVGNVEAAIMCADAILGSDVVKDSGAQIPSWVNSLFEVYGAVRHKDFPKLIYEVGITVACAVANYFTGVDVCGVVEELAKIAGTIVDGLEDVAEFFSDIGDALGLGDNCPAPTGQTQDQLFAELFIPVVATAAQGLSDPNTWDATGGHAWRVCMARCGGTGDKGNGQAVCDMMRGVFGGAANRQAAILDLPKLIQERSKAIAAARYNPLTSTDGLRQWAAAGIAGVMGYTAAADKAPTDPKSWPKQTTGLVAFTLLSSPNLFPPGDPDSVNAHVQAVKALADAEAAAGLQGQIDAYFKKQAENAAKITNVHVETSDGIAQKLLAACALPSHPSYQKQCEGIVATRDAACVKMGADFLTAHPEMLNPDSTPGKTAKVQQQGMLDGCRGDIQKWATQYVTDHNKWIAGMPKAAAALANVVSLDKVRQANDGPRCVVDKADLLVIDCSGDAPPASNASMRQAATVLGLADLRTCGGVDTRSNGAESPCVNWGVKMPGAAPLRPGVAEASAASKVTAPAPPVSWGGAPSPGHLPPSPCRPGTPGCAGAGPVVPAPAVKSIGGPSFVAPPSHTGHEALEKQGCSWVEAKSGFTCKTAAARDACVAAQRGDPTIKGCELSTAAPISWGR